MAELGKAFLLKAGDGQNPATYATLAGLRTKTRVDEAGRITISGQGIFVGSAAESAMRANALAGTLNDYELSFEDGEKVRGNFLVTRLEFVGDYNGERSYLIALDGHP